VSGLALSILLLATRGLPAAEPGAAADRRPVGEVLGRAVYPADLVPPPGAAHRDQGSPTGSASGEATRREKLRALVWTAVFEDYARRRRVEPTAAEIDSHLRHHRRFQQEDQARRERQRQALIAELGSPSLSEARRRQAQQHLDTLESLRQHDARMAAERRDPARRRMWEESERRVAEVWVRRWKIDQALHREFGGRIIFQQAGWEPIDAYRTLLEQYEARRAFVVHDPGLRDAVYGYFAHNFVYADEAKAKFYFEKPYWERTPAEMKAAGF
jgi:hypothetical protein